MSQKDQVVMITGASKGLGKALALAFAKNGAKLAICARGKESLNQVHDEIKALGAEVVAVTADASNSNDVDRFVSVTESTFGRVDVLINNASIFGPGPRLLLDYAQNDFEEVLKVNVGNPFLMTKRVLPGMLSRNQGSIINITSEAGKTGFGEWGAYGISKFAVEGLTQTWADELSETNVKINMVDPGEMDTEMHDRAVPDCDYELAQPKDIVDVFLYLASDESKSVNGKRFEAQLFKKGGE
ncbi:NAD(P)-dependent dehydrogenase (short-subunit alcohol dehydrogenase family) [Bacillus pakistanensis]|uniref:NAD(P)-dependent dehydrogenase (Short-subunit alcohol dehydrogenase family) n=1 Tax=Rossellomorea pakistanensis TaxID=992288 RepID=A0ABS2NBB2_9BACI|nr:SDR family oxidoreductase [Bacillus pakistanensis]MBM7585152.1 NAD(P)-dependent dehydrogenase (short-subunit alcohol dehydrogenase family) [Bacillus pakistanensis]